MTRTRYQVGSLGLRAQHKSASSRDINHATDPPGGSEGADEGAEVGEPALPDFRHQQPDVDRRQPACSAIPRYLSFLNRGGRAIQEVGTFRRNVWGAVSRFAYSEGGGASNPIPD